MSLVVGWSKGFLKRCILIQLQNGSFESKQKHHAVIILFCQHGIQAKHQMRQGRYQILLCQKATLLRKNLVAQVCVEIWVVGRVPL
ncbi:hypothetical protein HAV15_004135 [Penicillium sp. str. |nr:hypothetical protein HAV15_004135 [Penicillium sp. str. \